MTSMNPTLSYDDVVDFVKKHAEAPDVESMALCLRAHGITQELTNVAGRGRVTRMTVSAERWVHVWLQESLMGFGPKEWVVSAGPLRNFIRQPEPKKMKGF